MAQRASTRISTKKPSPAKVTARSDDHDSHRGTKRPVMGTCCKQGNESNDRQSSGSMRAEDGWCRARQPRVPLDCCVAVCRLILADRKSRESPGELTGMIYVYTIFEFCDHWTARQGVLPYRFEPAGTPLSRRLSRQIDPTTYCCTV